MDAPGDYPKALAQSANGVTYGPGCNEWFDPWERFFRFIHPDHWRRGRPARSQFADPELSMDWEALSTPENTKRGRPLHGVVSVDTSLCVFLNQRVRYDPIIGHGVLPDNPAHTLIVGEKGLVGPDEIAIRRKFGALCEVLIAPSYG